MIIIRWTQTLVLHYTLTWLIRTLMLNSRLGGGKYRFYLLSLYADKPIVLIVTFFLSKNLTLASKLPYFNLQALLGLKQDLSLLAI